MRSLTLKTVLVGAAFAAGSAFGADVGPPFEVTEFNRTLPNVPQRTDAQPAPAGASVLTTGPRGPQAPSAEPRRASAGASALTTGAGLASGVWANDHHFIAPAK